MENNHIVYWHLPGFCSFRLFNQVFINLMKDYPDTIRDGYKIGSVYGTFPGAIWNGGRSVFGLANKSEIESILNFYNSREIPVRFTWTNSLIEEKHLLDTYCNLIMKLGNNGLNQVLVNRSIIESYIRNEYPNYPIISSTTKRILDAEELKDEFNKNYHLVVLDYDLNHNQDILKEMKPYADKIELLVNEVCYPRCSLRSEHYEEQSRMQLEYDIHTSFKCPNKTQSRTFHECKKRPAFLSNEDIKNYISQGFVNYKIVGRGMPLDYVKESYLYYLVKEEHQAFIRSKIDQTLSKLMNARMKPSR